MKTGKKCLVCTSPDKDEINNKLVSGLSVRKVGEMYGISHGAIQQHRANHLPGELVKSKQLQDVNAATDLVEKIEDLYQKAYGLIDKAEKNKSFTGVAALIREARNSLELLARVTGDLKSGTHLTLIYSPQWIQLRQTLVKTLDKYPDAKAEVIEALEVHELHETIDG